MIADSIVGNRLVLPISFVPIEERKVIYTTTYEYWKRAHEGANRESHLTDAGVGRSTG